MFFSLSDSSKLFATQVNSQYTSCHPQYDLNNTIHAIFARSKFEKDMDYEALEPALRLASHLLDAECVIEYMWAVMCSTGHQSYGEEEADGDDDGEDESDDIEMTEAEAVSDDGSGIPLTLAEKAQVHSMLTSMASLVNYAQADIEGTTVAATKTLGPNQHQDRDLFPGRNREIVLSSSTYEKMMSLYFSALRSLGGQFSAELLTVYADIAVSLVHEVANVAYVARFWAAEVGLEGSAVSEDGFGLDLDELLTLWGVDEGRVMPMFRTEFWTEVVPALGSGALFVPRVNVQRPMQEEFCGVQ